ncbi:hypothetical protein Dda_8552 [Drechslerella dactyloides]|uniref:Rhodopsin domain-containing protein n=1 Tax=Drechslerella dactyloides TaxID=74499 RepID=A0AAD6IQU2_DREDA|nr:hypothetical protein Dda_8552 [Drechslerella dactyloides]
MITNSKEICAMKFASPPHPQTDADREYLTTLIPLFRNFPKNFEFPLATDPGYEVPVNTLYCFVTGMVICGLTTIIVLLRFWVRARAMGFGMDDWIMVPTFRRYLFVLLAVSYVFFLATIFVQIFQCGVPASRAFDLEANFDGTCITLKSLTVYGVMMSGHIILDGFTIFPPLLVLFRLPMSTVKKFNLGFLLILGCITMVCSGIRPFIFFKIMVNSYDISWNGTAVAFWGILETSLALIIASLPALNRPIVKFIHLDRLLSNSSGHRSLSHKLRFNRARETIYKGPTKFVRYTADATSHDALRNYLELGSLAESKSTSASDERLRRSSSGGDVDRDKTYPQIRVERSFHLTEERASDLDLEGGDVEEATTITQITAAANCKVARPPRAKLLACSRTKASREESEALTKRV